jgi:hypothetical protein
VHKEQFYLEGTKILNTEQNCRIKETRGHETKLIRERNKANVKEQIKFKCGIKL